MKVIKANGEEIFFETDKIRRSLERAGASKEVIQKVLSETEKQLYDRIPSKAIYKIVFKNLKKLNHGTAGKYHLKNAIMELGPAGFPFEKFIANILEADGYYTQTDQIVQGHCIKHEVDIIAEQGNKHLMIECKFHGTSGNICHVKNALYVYARFLDLEKIGLNKSRHAQKFHQGWLVTNTRFSSDAEKYGKCVGMVLLSWNYPRGNSLREIIDRKGLYPITCLSCLSKNEKQTLLNHNIVLCKTIYERPSELNCIRLSKIRKKKVLEEAKIISEK